jgi:hypothetical protein
MALRAKVQEGLAGSERGREGEEEGAGAAACGTSLEGALAGGRRKVEDLGWKRSARAVAQV